ncbi:mastermind-like protein 3 isoform X2 [Sorex araneus]|uniref:mastermind-like protein 3 isoform X2 n=1 Tax=Sorex araneus TaxID=42254 RepID=UPI002433BDAF|nr:mastermind-like protein 3 isoform X2 [Sorex araneus]
MGDFSAPAAAANGSSICISSSLGGAGIGVNNTPNSTPAAPSSNHPAAGCGAGGPGSGSVAVPKHSTVVERLRQRIEGCRRHHVNCENRYQQAQVEQLELERRDTVSLYQRTLEQRAKKAGAGSGKQQQQQPPSKAQQDAEAASAEQRNHTLIMLQETVKRKLEGARSPLNGDQQNGACDGGFSPTHKRLRRELAGGLEAVSLPLPAASPLQQLDLKPALPLAGGGGSHAPALLDDLGKNGRLPDVKLPANGCGELDEGLPGLQSKGALKQEPLEDPAGMDPSETSLSNQNKLFSDINLNDQEWQELIDELANTVPEDDIQDLFNEDFEEKKEPEFPQPAAETPLSQESLSVKSDPTHSPFAHVSLASPQARPASSGPPFSAGSAPPAALPSVAGTPAAPNPAGSPANCTVQSPQTPSPAHAPGQAPPRPGNGYLLTPTAGPGSDLSPAEQLKQMAAQQQQRVKFMHQKQQQQQQQQQQHAGQSASWSPLGPPSSPYGAAFTAEKPNSPLMYPQAFNSQNPIVPPMANNLQKTTMNNYLPPTPMNMPVSQPAGNLGASSLSKPHSILTYGNTKPLTHFNANLNQRMTPPMANPGKNPLMPYMQPQPQPSQPPSQAPRAHLSEEQKRLLLMKQKGVMNQPLAYASLPAHGQEQHPMGLPRSAGPLQSSVPPGSGGLGSGAAPAGAGFLGSQPQAALMKQMLLDQRAQLMEQQQFLREQRQQQQPPQQPQLARQHAQQQRSPYPVAQVGQFQGAPQDMAARSQAALQTMRPARLMAQNAGMMAMGPAQSPGSLASTASPSDMGLYSSAPSSQPGMYNLGAGMAPMLQHPNQSGLGMAHGQAPGPRQPGAAQGAGLVSGFGQNMLVNSALAPAAQQHPQMKGPVGAALARPQAPARLPSMMGAAAQQGTAGWPQRGLQAMPGRTSGEMGAFNNGASYPLPTGQPRLSKPPFPGALGQVVDASTGAVRTLAPGAAGRQMMPGLPAQPGGGQARPLVLPGLSPALPAFGQPPAPQQLPAGGFAAAGGPAQDTAYGYGGDGAGPPFPGLPDGPDLVDSIVKGGPGDEWMQELDELFGNP